MVTSISTSTFASDFVLYIRDDLRSNITDPLGRSGSGNQFIFTSHPKANVQYPIISVMMVDIAEDRKLGFQSSLRYIAIPLEITIRAKNEIQRSELTQDVINRLRSNEHAASGTIAAGMHDFKILSAVNVDEPGEAGLKNRIIQVEYRFVLGS